MWVNVRSLLAEGSPYDEVNMAAWNEALLRACARYPNMRIYDWASDVKGAWFVDDGIHFTETGYAARSRMIAAALKEAFPDTPRIRPTNGSNCLIADPEVATGDRRSRPSPEAADSAAGVDPDASTAETTTDG